MPPRHRRSPRRRRPRTDRRARAAAPLAIPVALAVIAGGVIAAADGGGVTRIAQLAGSGAASPGASAEGDTAVDPGDGQPGLAETSPADPAGNPIDLDQTAAQAASTMNCTLIVPASPLSARGLATPWQLGDGCSESNPGQQAFVEATILAPDGRVTVYNPLVITQGTTPAATPAEPTVPAGSQVIIDTGFNGGNLVLEGEGASRGKCVDAFGDSVIGQTAACNARAFYAEANAQIAAGTLKVPPLGTGSDGHACPTTESFTLVDQDQSDNIDSEYLLNGDGQTAQDTAANKNAMDGATVLANGSDDGLLDKFVDPALGCAPFTASSPTSADGTSGSQALNALSARVFQRGTRALLPVNDPQLLVDGHFSIGKTNTYRALVDQPPLAAAASENQVAAAYCQNLVNIQPARLRQDRAAERGADSPAPDVGTNLATFMGNRLSMSFTNLGCRDFGLKNPVTVTTDGNGAATAVSYDLTRQRATEPGDRQR